MDVPFDQQLRRLKESLGLKEDQQVAAALGMTKASFSDRKRRNAFPEERVIGLKARWPDLDVTYVLTGARWGAADRGDHEAFVLEATKLGLRATDVARAIAEGVAQAARRRSDALDNARVRSLIETLIWCDDDAIDLLLRVAARLRGTKAIPFSERAASRTPISPAAPSPDGRATRNKRR